MDLEIYESLRITFILASKCALVLLSLIAHTACLLTHDLDSEFRISQLGLLMGKSRDKRNGSVACFHTLHHR